MLLPCLHHSCNALHCIASHRIGCHMIIICAIMSMNLAIWTLCALFNLFRLFFLFHFFFLISNCSLSRCNDRNEAIMIKIIQHFNNKQRLFLHGWNLMRFHSILSHNHLQLILFSIFHNSFFLNKKKAANKYPDLEFIKTTKIRRYPTKYLFQF